MVGGYVHESLHSVQRAGQEVEWSGVELLLRDLRQVPLANL